LDGAGVVSLKVPQPVLKLSKTVRVSQGQSMLLAMPAKKFELQVEVHYPKPIGSQKLIFKDMKKFGKDIAWARTFGWMADLKNNRAAGRSRGARFDNAIGVREDGTFTSAPKPLEFVRHKALDLLGDLAVLGMPLQTKIFASRPGHALNSMLVEKIYESF
jgi:UDP-3-O-[3-hydroxymyristoyl] N-acetylglucosamine deacetylase